MRKMLAIGLLGLAGVYVSTASGQTYFSDNFENEAVGTDLGPPDVGTWSDDTAGNGAANGVKITDSPALGTRSVQIERDATTTPPILSWNADLKGYSIPGAVVDGNQVEVKWSHYLQNAHRFNNPMQVNIGYADSGFNGFAFVFISDANSGSYAYNSATTTVQPSLNAWDQLRAVFNFHQIDAATMGGTFDLFASVNGGAEVQLASNQTISPKTIPGTDPTVLMFRIAKGVSSGIDFYDNISVTQVPEPSMAALGAAACGAVAALRRRTRR